MPSIPILEFQRLAGIPFFAGGRKAVEVEDLAPEEENAVKKCLEDNLTLMEKVSPTLAATLRGQQNFFLQAARYMKGRVKKPISYPAMSGTIGVNFLIPQAIRYVATPSATDPAYTSYPANSWDLSLTAGTATWLFGDGTNYYKTRSTENQRFIIAIPKDCIIEIGSTPRLEQFIVKSEAETKYAPWTVHPLAELTIEPGKTLYQYPTIGGLILDWTLGQMLGAMPAKSGTSTVKLLGLYFYEYDFHSTLKWVA